MSPDLLFEQGENSACIYFIQTGAVAIFHNETGASLAELGPKEHFGEVAFFTGSPRCASARTLDFLEAHTLERDDFGVILNRFPETLRIY